MEKEKLTINKTNKTIEQRITNPKLFELSDLRTIVKDQIPLNDWEIIAVKNDEEIPLLNNTLREILSRTMAFGLPMNDFVEDLAIEMHDADSIIIRENSVPELKWLEEFQSYT